MPLEGDDDVDDDIGGGDEDYEVDGDNSWWR